MSRWSPFGLLLAAIRAFAPIVVVLVVGFGTSLHAHGGHFDDHGTQIGVHAGAAHDASEAGSILSPTHCGGGASCVAAVPSASMALPTPEAGRAQFATVTRGAPPSPTFGLLRPPRQG